MRVLDADGRFNAENRYVYRSTYEYVHANMGWGDQKAHEYWVLRDVYVFGNEYSKKNYFICHIKPK